MEDFAARCARRALPSHLCAVQAARAATWGLAPSLLWLLTQGAAFYATRNLSQHRHFLRGIIVGPLL